MVKVSTLFHRVDGFNEIDQTSHIPDILNQDLEDDFLHKEMERALKLELRKKWGAVCADNNAEQDWTICFLDWL